MQAEVRKRSNVICDVMGVHPQLTSRMYIEHRFEHSRRSNVATKSVTRVTTIRDVRINCDVRGMRVVRAQQDELSVHLTKTMF